MSKKGFTLIELLILVAIVDILATIAVPNFLEARNRSNLSRVKGEFRNLSAAIEAYTIDHKRIPREVNTLWYPIDAVNYAEWVLKDGSVTGILWEGLTTPTAYISRVNFMDPFQERNISAPYDLRHYTYQDLLTSRDVYGGAFWPAAYEYYGAWRLGSVGPDMKYSHYFINSAQLLYDPTNGVASLGNIWRTRRLSDGIPQPPTGSVLLGIH
ncbi:prepilin-type N-terminal cleavage/methylation domain-containing protein [Candidatus Sumerlaeota bacterium]|nr:prepilin-type N-terminal cleavage/methylation domain-containing protein [Candidatus Sumerlaeota bacterium]